MAKFKREQFDSLFGILGVQASLSDEREAAAEAAALDQRDPEAPYVSDCEDHARVMRRILHGYRTTVLQLAYGRVHHSTYIRLDNVTGDLMDEAVAWQDELNDDTRHVCGRSQAVPTDYLRERAHKDLVELLVRTPASEYTGDAANDVSRLLEDLRPTLEAELLRRQSPTAAVEKVFTAQAARPVTDDDELPF